MGAAWCQTLARSSVPALLRAFSLFVSLLAGRTVAYLQQFVSRGSPRRLPDDVRLHIAVALDLDETLIGARLPWMPAVGRAGHAVCQRFT